jgi:hypothetical protein
MKHEQRTLNQTKTEIKPTRNKTYATTARRDTAHDYSRLGWGASPLLPDADALIVGRGSQTTFGQFQRVSQQASVYRWCAERVQSAQTGGPDRFTNRQRVSVLYCRF